MKRARDGKGMEGGKGKEEEGIWGEFVSLALGEIVS